MKTKRIGYLDVGPWQWSEDGTWAHRMWLVRGTSISTCYYIKRGVWIGSYMPDADTHSSLECPDMQDTMDEIDDALAVAGWNLLYQ